MFRKWQFYFGANDYVEMTDGMDSSMLVSLGQRRRRRFLISISLLLALIFIAPAILVNQNAYLWLWENAPPVAQFLSPNRFVTEQNGIRINLEQSYREGDTFHIFVTFEDLEGDRLNGRTIPVLWSYSQSESASGSFRWSWDEKAELLQFHFFFTVSKNKDFDFERWGTLSVMDLQTDMGQRNTIEGVWTIPVRPENSN